MTANTTARLLAAHRAFRRGNADRAYRLAQKVGIPTKGTTPDRLWERVVTRLTGSVYGYAQADVLAGLPNQVPPAPAWSGRIIPMC